MTNQIPYQPVPVSFCCSVCDPRLTPIYLRGITGPSVSPREDQLPTIRQDESPHASMTGSSTVLFAASKPPGSLFYGIIGLSTSRSRSGLSTPQQRHPVPPHGRRLLCAPQKVSLKGGWVRRLAHNVRRAFEVFANKPTRH